jgi:hypothetical protein
MAAPTVTHEVLREAPSHTAPGVPLSTAGANERPAKGPRHPR